MITAVALIALALVAVLGLQWAKDQLGDYEPDCSEYSFDRDRWRADRGDAREDEAEALAECGVLVGMTRSEVTALLGPHPLDRRRTEPFDWAYPAGWVNDGLGVGDGQTLYIRFADTGKVAEAQLAYPQ